MGSGPGDDGEGMIVGKAGTACARAETAWPPRARLCPRRLLPAMAMAVLAGCSCSPRAVEPPPRSDERIPAAHESSVIAVPVDMDAALLTRAIEKSLPRTLWTIDQHSDRCIPPRRVRILGRRVAVTPPISCTIVGTVTRGPVRLRGEGPAIIADLPIRARISARDIGGILKGETATGSARVQAIIRLTLAQDWSPRGTIRLRYDWTTPPGIDFLGQRITFTDKADAHLRPIIRDLERRLPRELQRVHLRAKVEGLWRGAFRSILLNERNPPVWMRLTPRRLIYDGHIFEQGQLRLNLGLDALTETFVGARPADPAPTPLPPPAGSGQPGELRFFIPVVADYGQIEPVILRALVRRSARPFDLPGVGPVMVRFGKVTAYGTRNGRIAVGLAMAAQPQGSRLGETHGVVWMTARPVNAPNSATIRFEDLALDGITDGIGGNLLLRLAREPAFSALIAQSLTQNFANDIDGLLVKVRRAIAERQEGDFAIRARIASVETGRIAAYGTGFYLPVRLTGQAHIDYRPAPAPPAQAPARR